MTLRMIKKKLAIKAVAVLQPFDHEKLPIPTLEGNCYNIPLKRDAFNTTNIPFILRLEKSRIICCILSIKSGIVVGTHME